VKIGLIERLLRRRNRVDAGKPIPILEGIRGELSEAQFKIVTAPLGYNLVLAGPGSGKTRTMTYYVYRLLMADNVDPRKIAVLTFTREAAREAQERLERFVGEAAREVFVGTFHSFGLQLLKKRGLEARILSPEESLRLWKEAGGSEELLRRVGFFLGKGWEPPEEARGVIQSYKEKKGKALDFADLIDVLDEMEDRYHFVVDEFQDVDWAQFRAIRKASLSLFAVGDPNQAIYGWRGGDRTIITNFPAFFPDARVHYLQENWRSGRKIVEYANRIISLVKGVPMIPARKEEGEVVVEWASAPSEVEEVVEREVGEALRLGEGVAVLARSNEAVRSYKEHLEAVGLLKDGGETLAAKLLAGLIELVLFPEEMRGVSRLLEIDSIPPAFKEALIHARGPYHLWERNPGSRFLLVGLHALNRVRHGRSTLAEERDALRKALSYDPVGADPTLTFLENLLGEETGEKALQEALKLLLEESERSLHPASVLTYHRSKGLEFDRVVVVLPPPGRKHLPPDDLLAVFVAVTRARRRLVVVFQGKPPEPLGILA
jgi:superfamily I DNA/RNA helicase